ncbi:unnamed protein product, partial [Meganyctiphanes norvegica]
VTSFPNLTYTGKVLCVTLVCDVSDESALWLATVVKQLCPDTRHGELTELGLQNTRLTGAGVAKILTTMHQYGLSVSRWIKVWTSVSISHNDREEVKHLAKRYSFGALQI